jgi:hypothetical protein
MEHNNFNPGSDSLDYDVNGIIICLKFYDGEVVDAVSRGSNHFYLVPTNIKHSKEEGLTPSLLLFCSGRKK